MGDRSKNTYDLVHPKSPKRFKRGKRPKNDDELKDAIRDWGKAWRQWGEWVSKDFAALEQRCKVKLAPPPPPPDPWP